MTTLEPTTSFLFDPTRLKVPRKPGLSGFMRIRNGEDWVKESVLSHLDYMDEVVAVYNECTDRTPVILAELQAAYPDKIRVVHYQPEVYPVGSDLHIQTPPNSVHSIANYYNYALSLTRYSIATKLDDDHIAIRPQWEAMRKKLEAVAFRLDQEVWCFSGINLVSASNKLHAHAGVSFAGNGDHWLFEVTPQRIFTKDNRFERFNRRGLKMKFMGIAYWHLKYLKKDHGFSNYALDQNPNSRYHKQKARFEAGKQGITLEELAEHCRDRLSNANPLKRWYASLSPKRRLAQQRDADFDLEFLQGDLALLEREVIFKK